MNKKYKVAFLVIIILGFISVAAWYIHGLNITVLNPKGPIARKERDLIYTALALALIVVIPVYTMAILFSWRYREGNTKAKYSPELSGNRVIETIWWLIPSAIILALAIITWRSTHLLAPTKAIASNNAPLTIQVVALDWKWLFIYPKQNIASVNFFQFPKDTPLRFNLTADAPMNSFWIPQLGGQIYTMPGMSTEINLMSTSYGTFNGVSANISGQGFAGMTFKAKSSSSGDFNNWIDSIKHSNNALGSSQYDELAQPSEYNQTNFYSSTLSNLYNRIINKYAVPGDQTGGVGNNSGSVVGMAGMEMR